MLEIGLGHYLTVAAILFTLGLFGVFLNRKNIIIILMSIELMLLAVNINLVAFSAHLQDLVGQVFAMFVLTVAAAEAAIGEKFKLLDADNDGIISLEELLNVTNVCKTTEVGADAESELRELLKDLSDEEGFVRVEDLKRLSLEMLRLEAAEEEEEEEEEDSRKSMAVKKSSS